MSRRSRWILVLMAVALVAFAVPAAASGSHTRTYTVTITNLTEGQPFTPPLAATHRRSVELFEVGDDASDGIKEIAENGNLSVLQSELESNHRVSDVVVAVGDTPPVEQGETITFEITGDRRAKFFSYASMLICTNDGFTGDRVRLPRWVGQTVTSSSVGYDAGTEINTEQLVDIVPPCQDLTGVGDGTVPGTGMSNPALAEHGEITKHDGVLTTSGVNTLLASVNGWNTQLPVAVITITRTD